MTSSTFLNTTVFQNLEYTEIKAVCLTTLQATPDASIVNSIVTPYTAENLANLSIVELEKKGGPAEGSFLVEGHNVKYGITYTRDENGNIQKDENGDYVIAEDNGVLYGLAVGDAHKKLTFNAIVVYGTEINAETNTPVVGVVSMFNNSLSLDKILNFFARYIITISKELIELKFEWVNIYGEHEKETNNSTFYMGEQHPQLMTRVMLSSQGDATTDEFNLLQKQYELFIKDRDDYLYIKPVKENKFEDEMLSNAIQTHQNARLYKYEDSTIKTPYLYFYYNLVAARKMILQGIVDNSDNTEDAGAVEAVSITTLRKHIKIGFSETMGPFLYTWLSTNKFIYVICYGSNSNNNVDIYRVRNRGGYDINDVNYNLIVGKYLDRIYFTINGDLHVCVPQVGGKTTESNVENDRFRAEAAKSLETHEYLYVDFNTLTDSAIESAYKTVWDDIDLYNSATYLLNKEQLYILILSKSNDYSKYVTNGAFSFPADVAYTPTNGYTTAPTTASEFMEQGLFQPNSDGKSTIQIQDKRNVYKYLKNPIDKILKFCNYIDSVTKACISYKDDYGTDSYKTPYVSQVSIALIERMNPNYPTDTNYAINWWGQNKQSGAKYNALFYALKNGDAETPQPSKYDAYVENYLTEDYKNSIVDILLNAEFRESVETVLPVTDTFNVYSKGIVERLALRDPSYSVDAYQSGFQQYFFKEIFKDNDIVATESELRAFYRYSLYRALFDNVVASSKSYQQYVIREYLINEEKADANNGDIIDSFNSMSIAELDAYFEANKIAPLSNFMNEGSWWNNDTLEKLEELYLGVIETPLSITYAFGSKDDVYYNGVKKTGLTVTTRDAVIPYRYGFPFPNYIYNSKDSDLFIIPSTESVNISGTYATFDDLKADVMIPRKDGEADTKADIDKLTTLTADIIVDQDSDVFALTTTSGTITEQNKENFNKISYWASSSSQFPLIGQTDAFYYSQAENAVYKYEGTDYLYAAAYPQDGGIYQIDGVYYKPSMKEIQADYSVLSNANGFTAEAKTYSLKLNNISKYDTTVAVDLTDNSTDSKVEYALSPTVVDKEYVISFTGLSPTTEGDTLTIIIAQNGKELLNQQITDNAYQFKFTPTSTDEITVSIDKATVTNASCQYIASDNFRTLTITETDVDGKETILLERTLDFSQGSINQEVVEITSKGGEIAVSLEQGNIGSVEATYKDSFNKIESWNAYQFPTAGTIAQALDTQAFYEYDGAIWNSITLQEIRNQYTNKIYYVKDESKYYRFGGMNWVAINPVYDILKGAIYKITNDANGLGIQYYEWSGSSFDETNVTMTEERNSCNWYLEDIAVYFNIFIEGDKLSVIRDLFKGKDGETLKVVQFDFSDIGDVVLVRDYNKQGQNIWGGVFSRYATSTSVDSSKKIYNYGAVMSDNFMECFNWDAYNYVAFTFRADGSAYISDERIRAIQATYEVSRTHFEVLYHKFGDNLVFSNALTVGWEKTTDEPNYSHSMYVYPKNVKMFPNLTTMPYSGIRFLVNNYFVIEGNAWFDIIYNRTYTMNTGIQPRYYQNRFLSAMRSLVVVAISDHDDEKGYTGAVSYFSCNNWYDKTKVTDYIEKANIPQKDI